jgi:hypothetical protein
MISVSAAESMPLLQEEALKRKATSGPGVYGGKPLVTETSGAVSSKAGSATFALQCCGVSNPLKDREERRGELQILLRQLADLNDRWGDD